MSIWTIQTVMLSCQVARELDYHHMPTFYPHLQAVIIPKLRNRWCWSRSHRPLMWSRNAIKGSRQAGLGSSRSGTVASPRKKGVCLHCDSAGSWFHFLGTHEQHPIEKMVGKPHRTWRINQPENSLTQGLIKRGLKVSYILSHHFMAHAKGREIPFALFNTNLSLWWCCLDRSCIDCSWQV